MIARFFYPDDYVKSIRDIDYGKIYASGIRGLIFDIDNTVVAYNSFEVSNDILDLFKNLADMGFGICFLSNSLKKRVTCFCDRFGVRGFHMALKPTPFRLMQAIKYLGLPRSKLAIIGDQVFTDVICGRTQNIYTILVSPIEPEKSFIKKIKRRLEKAILNEFLLSKTRTGREK